MNDAVYQREIAVEDRLNTELHAEKLSSDEHGGDLLTRVGNSVQANDKAYDILANSNFTTANSMPNGYYLNLLEMENLNLSKEYWAHFLFMNDWVYAAGTAELREMESDYGIIPYPKYDEAQDKYYSYLHDQFTTFCVLVTVEDPADIGAVLEAMCSESHNSVISAYYDVALTSKYARDTDSVLSLETIFSNPYLDTGWVYSDNLASLPQMILREPVWRGTGSPATTVKQREKMVNKVMGMLVEKFAKAAGKG